MTMVLTEDDIAVGDVVSEQLEKMWGWYLAWGIVSVIFGFFVISYRHASVYAVVYLASGFFIAGGIFEIIGWAFLVLGIFDIIESLRHHHMDYWWAYLIRGIIAVAIGFLCIRHPGAPLTALVVLIGILAIVFGVVEIIGSFSARHATKSWEAYKASSR